MLLLVFQAVMTLAVCSRGYFFQDDYVFIQKVSAVRVPTVELLFSQWGDHLMPGGMLLVWATTHMQPFSYGLVVGELVVAQLAAGWLVRRALIAYAGPGPAHVVGFAFYATSMCVLAATGWWAAALTSLPTQLALAAVLIFSVRYCRRRGLASLSFAVIALIGGLAFSERAIFVPIVVVLLIAARDRGPDLRSSTRAILRRGAPLWAALSVVLIAGAALYVATRSTAAELGGLSLASVGSSLGSMYATLGSSVFGGPWSWRVAFEAFAAPPWFLLALVAEISLILVAWAVYDRRARRWLVLGALTCTASVVLLMIGRPSFAGTLSQAPRYYAEIVPFVALVAAGLIHDPRTKLREILRTLVPDRPWTSNAYAKPIAIAVGCQLLVLSAVASTSGYSDWLTSNPSRDYVSRTVSDLKGRAGNSTPVLDGRVPTAVMGSGSELGAVSALFRLVSGGTRYVQAAEDPDLVLADGGVGKGVIEGSPSITGPDGKCGWLLKDKVTIPLADKAPEDATVMRMGFLAAATTQLLVQVGGSAEQVVPISRGLGNMFVNVSGATGDSVVFTNTQPGSPVCIDDVVVGTARSI